MSKRNILVLCRKDDRATYDTARSMAQGLNSINQGSATYVPADLEDLIFAYDQALVVTTADGIDLRQYDAVFLLGWFKTKILEDIALSVSTYADFYNIPCVNSEARYTRSRTKLSQYVFSALHGINTIPFVFSLNSAAVVDYVAKQEWDTPFIAKGVMASRGKDNYLVDAITKLPRILTESPEVFFVVQHFIPNDGDYRIITVGDQVSVVIHRQSQGDTHLNNTSQGGEAKLVPLSELPAELIEQSLKITQLLRRDVGGVDMIVDKNTGKHFFLEANNMPQLSTGSLVEAKLVALDAYLVNLECPKATS